MTTQQREVWRLLAILGLMFFGVGVSQGVFGPVLPELASRTGAGIVAVGSMFTVMFAAGFAAQTLAALFGRRLGQTRLLAGALVLNALGFSGIALSHSLETLLASALLAGAGNGVLFLAGNVIAAEASDRAGPLNFVNALFGVGAIAGPALVWLSLTALGPGVPALWATPAALALALVLLLALGPRPAASPAGGPAPQGPATAPRPLRAVLASPLVWLLGAFCFLAVSLEIGVSTWLATLLQRATGLPLTQAAKVMSMFWALMTAGRLAAAWASSRLEPRAILRVSAGLCLAGAALLLAGIVAQDATLAIVATALIAPAIGPNLPTAIALVRTAFSADANLATGVAFGLSNLAGATVPVLLGALAETVGAPAVAAAYLALSVALTAMLGLVLRGMRRAARRQAHPAAQA